MAVNTTNSSDLASRLHDPARWMAVLRIAIGLWFVKALWTKWVWIDGVVPVPMATARWRDSMSRVVAGYADSNPLPWVKSFLEEIVLQNPGLFAHLTAIGEGVVGLGLVLGLLTGLAAMIGLLITIAYTLGGIGLPLNELGLRLITLFAMLAFLFARAGKAWSVDAWIARRYRHSLVSRFPLA